MYDIDTLQESLSTNVTDTINSGIEDQISKIIVWMVVPAIILSILILVLYILHALRRRKVENAILDIRDTLHHMEQAQVASSHAPIPTQRAAERAAEAVSEQSYPI